VSVSSRSGTSRSAPGGGVSRAAVRPLAGRRDQCLLDRVLGRVELHRAADDGAEHRGRELAPQGVDARALRHISTPASCRIGRRSSLSPSTIVKLARCSLAST